MCVPVLGLSYDFSVGSNGRTAVDVTIEGNAVLDLPKDVTSPDVDGKYKLTSEGVEVEGKSLSYVSDYHTRKEDRIWYFEADVDGVSEVTLPSSVQIVQVDPQASISEGHIVLFNTTGKIKVSYVIPHISDSVKKKDNWFGVVFFVFLIFVLVILYPKGKEEVSKKGRSNITDDCKGIST